MYRLNGKLPKVGIRATIDGRRRGVRESLEGQAMDMAKMVAKFIEENLKYPSGESVECYVFEETIGRVPEAARCEQKFKDNNVGVSLTVTPCWCYGTETIDCTLNIPKAIWGFNGTERPGAVYLAAAAAGHAQIGDPVFSIYGKHVQDGTDKEIPEDVKEKILKFVESGLAVALMKGKSYLSIGSVSMGIAGSIVNPDFFSDYLGMRNEYVDMVELKRRVDEEIYDAEEFKKAMEWTKLHCKEGEDCNNSYIQKTREAKDKDWEIVVKMTIIMRDLMIGNKKLKEKGYIEEAEGHNAIAAGFQGQRQWTDYMPNGDFSEAILNSSFDWNGIREAFVVATENDSLNGVAMLFGHLLTGRAQIFSDVRTFWSPEAVKRVTGKELDGKAKNGLIHLINSGSSSLDGTGDQIDKDGNRVMKPFWEVTEEEVNRCLDSTKWCEADLGYFRGGGYSSQFLTKGEMPITMTRINLIKGLGPVLQIAEGYAVDIQKDVHDILDRRTNFTWPTTWFAPNLTGEGAFTDVHTVMDTWGANHGAISYGHVGDKFITLASMLRIPVAMHNVSDEKIFRPKVWSSFGTIDKEGADYRACKNFGPIYGKLKG